MLSRKQGPFRQFPPADSNSSSLFVALNHVHVANACGLRIEARDSFRSALTQKIPTLVQILFELPTSFSFGLAGTTLSYLPEELVLLVYQLAYPLSDVFIFHLDSP
jgi:hypothetical protein